MPNCWNESATAHRTISPKSSGAISRGSLPSCTVMNATPTRSRIWRREPSSRPGALEQFDGRAPFEHWLSRIAVRVALDHLRREKKRRNEIGLPELGEDALDWLRSDDEKSELDGRAAAEILDLALRELSPADRVVITMQEIEGCRVKEICAATGASGVAMRVRALRARAKLKRALEKLIKL